jgi:cysteine sulfinate desulfinase/cysteine desulfurase-like protein
VLLAMGRTPQQALGSLRFSVGYGNDEAQIDEAAQRLSAVLERSG